ncbi:MAG: vitamin K epoxide reductase family protein [Candidatus Paceibacterota bacterium]|jgi:uncharacterized membrane protein
MKKFFHRWAPWLLLASTIVGFVDSVLIHQEITSGQPIGCFIVRGCTDVLHSPYNNILGISLAYVGMVFYLGLAALLVGYMRSEKKWFEVLYGVGVGCGIIFSLYLFVVQGFVLGAFCSYCLLSLINMVAAGALYVSWGSVRRRMVV